MSTGGDDRLQKTGRKIFKIFSCRRNILETSGGVTYSDFFFTHILIVFQIQLKDLLRTGGLKKTTPLKDNSLMELMKLKPPSDIAQPVATATATGHCKKRNMDGI